MEKGTYQPRKLKRIRKFGFMARMETKGGRKVLAARRLKGRKFLTASEEFKLMRKKPVAKMR